MSDWPPPEHWWESDYFHGYRASKPHPMMTSTGSEGRCDICGSSAEYVHREPYERITYQEFLAERLTAYADAGELPIRPMFAWERTAPLGEGAAGNYLAHLRASGRKPGAWKLHGAVTGRMSFDPKTGRYEHVNEKEDTMSISITVDLEFDTIANLVNALLDLSDYDGLKAINVTDKVGVNAAIADAVAYGSVAQKRFHADLQPAIREYLVKAIDAQTRGEVEVEIEYEAEGTGERSTRKTLPRRMETRRQAAWPYNMRDYLILKDVEKGESRTFLVDNILSVSGPVL